MTIKFFGRSGTGVAALRVQQVTANVPAGQTGAIGSISSNSLVAALLAPVAYAKTGGSTNLTISNAGVYANTAAINGGATQSMTVTVTGADGFPVPFTFALTGSGAAAFAPSLKFNDPRNSMYL